MKNKKQAFQTQFRRSAGYLFIAFSLAIMASCAGSNGIDPSPDPIPPSPPAPRTVLLKSSDAEVERLCWKAGSKVSVSDEDLRTYFGERISRVVPTRISYSDDSLFIEKGLFTKESYKYKWESAKLMLYRDADQSWQEVGEKATDGTITLYITLNRAELHIQATQTTSLQNIYGRNTASLIFSDPSTAYLLVRLVLKATYLPKS